MTETHPETQPENEIVDVESVDVIETAEPTEADS